MTSAYNSEKIHSRLVTPERLDSIRILWARHNDTPLKAPKILSRFSNANFGISYSARYFRAAFAETVIRDRFVFQDGPREVPYGDIALRSVVSLSVYGATFLNMMDDGCLIIGAATDSIKAENHDQGRAFGSDIYRNYPEIDGICYPSRMDGSQCYALFDRAINKASLLSIGPLSEYDGLLDVLKYYNIELLMPEDDSNEEEYE